jgi:hypothetical protein
MDMSIVDGYLPLPWSDSNQKILSSDRIYSIPISASFHCILGISVSSYT